MVLRNWGCYMSTKKKKKKNAGPAKAMVRLSQCMIVKNEEKNIEKALRWAKGVAFEQIVVDTGSTDNTVEIAKKMGATVYHFEWISDFAAAKNYAIEQATGNWIAFLDADEYYSSVDAKKVMVYLRNIMADPQMRQNYLALNCKISNVDDEGKPFSVFQQQRIFRNIPSIRFVGKIHERLTLGSERVAHVNEITIIHTGYSRSAYQETNKAERNIEMIKKELDESPDNPDLMVYLADSLWIRGDETSAADALALYRKAIDSDRKIHTDLRKSAYIRLIEKGINSGEDYIETELLCKRALELMPGDMDFEYFLAMITFNLGEQLQAWEIFKRVEAKLMQTKSLEEARIVTAKPIELLYRMVRVAQTLGDIDGVVKYASMVLATDKKLQDVLCTYMGILLSNNTSEEEMFGLLSKLYDLNDPNDLLLIAKAAKDCGPGALSFTRKIIDMIRV